MRVVIYNLKEVLLNATFKMHNSRSDVVVNMRVIGSSWDTVCRVLNALKNNSRRSIILLLGENGGMDIAELQRQLKARGHVHSKHTILTCYIDPLIRVGILSRRDDGCFELTAFGRRIFKMLDKLHFLSEFPYGSKCYEELALVSLIDGPRDVREVLGNLRWNEISRIIGRISKYVVKSRAGNFFKIEKEDPSLCSRESELEVFNILKELKMAPVKEIIKRARIKPRTVYKRVNSLLRKGVVSRVKRAPIMELTDEGRRVASALARLIKLIEEENRDPKEVLKKIVIECLRSSDGPMSEIELVERCISPKFRELYGKDVDPEVFLEIKRELKREGILEGDPYTGYYLKCSI